MHETDPPLTLVAVVAVAALPEHELDVAALPVHEAELPLTLPVKVDEVELAKLVHETDPPLTLVAVLAVPDNAPTNVVA